MKASMLAFTLVAMAATFQPALAQASGQPGKAPQVQTPAVNPADFDKQLSQVRDAMQRMQEQMNKLAQTKDPQERQRLLQEHWTTMQATMSVMRVMWNPAGAGPGMMGGPMMGWGHMRGYYSGLTPDQLRQRQYMMDQYLPMQQMMMDHMMWQQYWGTPPAKEPPPAGR